MAPLLDMANHDGRLRDGMSWMRTEGAPGAGQMAGGEEAGGHRPKLPLGE